MNLLKHQTPRPNPRCRINTPCLYPDHIICPNPRQSNRHSWILDPTSWIPHSRYLISVFVDSNRYWDSGFLELFSGFQSPGFRIPGAKISHIPLHGPSCTLWFFQGFWYFARSRTREIQVFPRNPVKFAKKREIPRNSPEIFPNTCRQNIFNAYHGY